MSPVKRKFKPGDTVRCTRDDDSLYHNELAIVLSAEEVELPKSILEDDNIVVRFPNQPNNFKSITDDEKKPWNHYDFWQMAAEDFELVECHDLYCPQCESTFPLEGDYLCGKCRYGV